MDTKLLRQKILDLAIRGKLVPQDPNDEPASVLLERIKAEKEQLIKAGKIKCPKKAATTSDSRHYPFELPDGWVWTTLGEIAESNIGLTYKPSDVSEIGIPVYRSNNIQDRKICLDNLVRVQSTILPKQYLNEGDLLICARNGSRNLVGKCALITELCEPTSFGAFMAVCRSIFNPWIYFVLNSNYFNQYLNDSNSTAINQVTQKMLLSFLIPLPPIKQQKRIVTEVKNWFSVIDGIEKGKDYIVELISQTKSKILNMAIHGKLVPQDPADEPAIELLKRVNPNAEITSDNEHNRKLRQGWCSLTVNDICTIIGGVSYNKADIQYKGIRVLRGGNIHNSRIIDCSDDVFLPISYQNDDNQVQQGDIIVVASTGSKTLIGKTGFADRDIPKTQIGAFLRIVRPKQKALSPFLRLIFQTDNYKDYIRNVAKGSNINNVKNAHLQKYQISLPPLAEQQRIVSKIEELFAQLDTIANSLQV